MAYPNEPDYRRLTGLLSLYLNLKHEYGAKGIEKIHAEAERALQKALRKLKRLPPDPKLASQEPNGLRQIRALRPKGPRRIWEKFDAKKYAERLEGAWLARAAGCTLGAIVEGWSIEDMREWAEHCGDEFPPVDYWSRTTKPFAKRYGVSLRRNYTRKGMHGIPADDDLVYTLLGLFIVEDSGPDFTIEDVGRAWLKYLPYACTAEAVALRNLKKGIPARKAGAKDNPYCEWIGADIRSDPWGYMAPGLPEKAAEMAYRDAWVSHRRNGIYGEMYFSAAIAAAFAVDDPVEALRTGLTEIPRNCSLAKAVRWALRAGKKIRNYRQAREAVDRKFPGMSNVHTINNACLTIFGLMIGGTDVTRVISETVAMGMDNDCTAATAGSIAGAIAGKNGVPRHWTRNFNNTVHSYFIGRKKFSISGILRRFTRQAKAVWKDEG